MNRRELLAGAAAAALPVGEKHAASAARVWDVHAHVVPAAYAAFLKSHGVALPGLTAPPASAPPTRPMAHPGDAPEHLAARLHDMDAAGVRTQILSPTITPHFDDVATATAAARIANDALLAIASRAPERFRVFCVLPMPHMEAAAAELTRMLAEPAVAGVMLSCAYGERSAADADFEPLYAALDRAAAVVFYHPAVNGLCSRLLNDWHLAAAAGPTFEDSVIAMHLMVRQIPARHRNIRFIVPHLAGGLATLLRRLDNQLTQVVALAEAPTRTAQRLWYDTCCHGSLAALRAAADAFGVDRLLPGSDYPFLTPYEAYADTLAFIRTSGLSDRDADAILHRNIELLFGARRPPRAEQ
jgi:aminocarboxymuconate-semialdehyde decarboxylase